MAASVVAGILLSILWSYEFVDSVIGDNVANTLLGREAKTTPITGTFAGLVFAFVYLGLAALGVVKDVFAGRPTARVVVLGALVGAFLIGRPYPMFVKLFGWASETGNPLYGAATFALQSIGNILLVSLVFAVLILGTRGGFLRWLAGNPRRMSLVSGTMLLALGVFTVVYWDVRVPSIFGLGWFPTMPYN